MSWLQTLTSTSSRSSPPAMSTLCGQLIAASNPPVQDAHWPRRRHRQSKSAAASETSSHAGIMGYPDAPGDKAVPAYAYCPIFGMLHMCSIPKIGQYAYAG